MTFLLGQLVHYFVCPSDEAVIRRWKRGAFLGAGLLLDCSVALFFSFSEGDSDSKLDF